MDGVDDLAAVDPSRLMLAAGTHQSTRYVSSFLNHRLRLRITDVWPLVYTNARSVSIDFTATC